MTTLGIITTRKGSKRLPDKNIKKLGGKALFHWTVDSSMASNLDHVIISTNDDAVIGRTSSRLDVIRRPDYLALDRTPHLPVVYHAVEWYAKAEGFTPEAIMILQPTSPFRTKEHINFALGLFEEQKADTVISVNKQNQPNGAIYLFRTELLFSKNPTFYGKNLITFQMGEKESINIDTQEDWDKAEKFL